MSQYLLDTNIVSELRKGSRCDTNVAHWHSTLDPNSTRISVLVIAEIRRGIELLRKKDAPQAAHLDKWLSGLRKGFSSKILPVDEQIAEKWGIINSTHRMSSIDGFLAATAMVHDLILVTRNVSDIERCGVKFFNPFE